MSESTIRNRRVGAVASSAAAALVLAGCSLLGPAASDPTTPAATSSDGSDDEFGAACTGEGAFSVDSSAYRPLDGVVTDDGEQVQAALGFTAADGPSARLLLQPVGASAEPLEVDGEVGADADSWGLTFTITSICEDEVGFDVE